MNGRDKCELLNEVRQKIAEKNNIEFGHYKLPRFDVPEGFTAQTYLETLCREGLRKRYGNAEAEKFAELEERLDESRFVRISRFELVNIRMISGFDLSMAGTIKVSLKDGTETWVARRYVRTIQEKFMSINQGGKDHE